MALNVISNFAANVAHRNLVASDAATTSSLTKLSSGQRVVSAKDDAASLAIGSRLRAEVVAMKTASVNAGQAGSMLQIADGAMATIADILVRMKELAVQASSGQFSSVERTILDSEFQALSSEITRISSDTEFNGTQLIAGTGSTVTSQFASDFTTSGNGFSIAIDASKVADDSAFRLSFETITAVAQVDTSTMAGVAIGDVFTIKITDNTAGTTYTATFTATTASDSDMAAGLVAAVNDIVGVTVIATQSTDDVIMTANTAGQAFSVAVSKTGSGTITNISVAGTAGGDFLTVSDLTTTNGNSVTVNVASILDAVVSTAGANLSGTETAKVVFDSLGVTVTLDANFDRDSATIKTLGTVSIGVALQGDDGFTASYLNDNNGGVTNDAITALLALGSAVFDSATGDLTLTITGAANEFLLSAVGIKLGVDDESASGLTAGAVTGTDLDAIAATVQIYVTTANGIDVQIGEITGAAGEFDGTNASSIGTIVVNVGELLFGNTVAKGSTSSDFTFKVGTGNQSYDSLTFTVKAASASALSLDTNSITTAALAETASTSVSAAIDTLNQSRSDVGAAQNRLGFARDNLASAIENAEAARSNLLDLDVAAEITVFTSKQVLLQTGIAMLAQANQLPQNLLRLFQ